MVVAAVAAIAGCATGRLDSASESGGAPLAYLIKAMQGDRAGRDQQAKAIAVSEFSSILRQKPPATDGRLPPWERHLANLIAPIVIPATVYEGSPLLNEGDKAKIRTFIRANPDVARIAGPTYLPEWTRETDLARQQVMELHAQRQQEIGKAKERLEAKDYAGAMQYFQNAWAIKSGERDIAREISSCTSEWAIERGKEIETTWGPRLARMSGVAKEYFGSGIPNEKAVQAVGKELALYDKAATRVREEAVIISQAAPDAKSRQLAEGLLETLGKQSAQMLSIQKAYWKENLRVLAQTKAYWEAYKLIDGQLAQVASSKSQTDRELAALLRASFENMLPAATEYLLEQANSNYTRDRYGAAVTFCFMADEVLDYAKRNDLDSGKIATTWQKRIHETREDIVKKLQVRLSRKLIILDFMIALTDEGENFGYHLRNVCRQRYEGQNPLTWALMVPSDRSLTAKDINATDADYVVPGHVREITVHQLPPRDRPPD